MVFHFRYDLYEPCCRLWSHLYDVFIVPWYVEEVVTDLDGCVGCWNEGADLRHDNDGAYLTEISAW